VAQVVVLVQYQQDHRRAVLVLRIRDTQAETRRLTLVVVVVVLVVLVVIAERMVVQVSLLA
jgi:hypothetical protein